MNTKTKKWLGIAAGGAVIFGGIAYALGYGEVLKTANSYDAEYQAAVREGAIISPTDLRTRYADQKGENAASYYAQLSTRAESLFKSKNFDYGVAYATSLKNGCRTDATLRGRTDELLKIFGSVDAYLAATKCDFQYRYEDGFALNFQEMVTAKKASRMFLVAAHMALEKGDQEGFKKYARAAIKAGTDLSHTPVLIALLVNVAILVAADHDLVEVAKSYSTDPATLAAIREVLNVTHEVDVKPAMEGEMCFQWLMLQHIKENLQPDNFGNDSISRKLTAESKIPGMQAAWKTECLRWLRKARRTIDLPASQWREQSATFAADSVSLDELAPSKHLSALITPVFSQAFSVRLRPEANRQCALAVIDILEAHQKAGAWPATLPIPRLDPYSGQPLTYRVTGDNWSVMSFGADGKEDAKEGNRDDVKFSLRPEKLK